MSGNTIAIDYVYLLALKTFLNVPMLTTNVMCTEPGFGDTGIYHHILIY